MVIKQNLSLIRILRTTWRTDVFLVLTCMCAYYLHEFVVPKAIQLPSTLATLLGTALAFFVGFNNNEAYDRWWEARTIWGALVNDCRSWTRSILHYTVYTTSDEEEIKVIQKRIIFRQISFVYALKETLRKKPDNYFEKYLSEEEVGK